MAHDTTSQAQAEDAGATTESATPQTHSATQETTTAQQTPEQILAGTDVEAIRALMRENADALVQSKKTSWEELGADDEPPGDQPGENEQPADDAEALPGETTDPPPPEPDPAELPKRDRNRVRINRFAEDDRAVIARMAETDGLTIDAARAELVAEGKIRPSPAASSAAAPVAAVETAAPIAAQQGVIAELEKQIEDAGASFDMAQLAKLNIAHNKALRELGKLETQAETAQASGQSQLAAAVEQSAEAALKMFPDAGVEGSAHYEAIEDLMDAADPAAFKDPDWPLTFAARAASRIGPAAAAPAKPAPVVVPKKPARPAPPSPASGASQSAGPTRVPSMSERIDAAGDNPAKIAALLREVGTRSLDD